MSGDTGRRFDKSGRLAAGTGSVFSNPGTLAGRSGSRSCESGRQFVHSGGIFAQFGRIVHPPGSASGKNIREGIRRFGMVQRKFARNTAETACVLECCGWRGTGLTPLWNGCGGHRRTAALDSGVALRLPPQSKT
jgi:hypothetical protein